MKKLLPLTAILLSTQASSAIPKMIYGYDDRYEVDSFYAMQFKDLSKSVAGMVRKEAVWKTSDKYNFGRITLETLKKHPGSQFYNQTLLTECSGFLVAPNRILTAGHCVLDQADCNNHFWTFGFTEKEASKGQIKISSTANCSKIISSNYETGNPFDYALIELDRSFTDIKPLKVRTSGRIDDDANLVMIGHPQGLPKKLTKNAHILNNEDENIIFASLDAFTGNSGSPVINADTMTVEGILVGGNVDEYEDDDGSLVINICPENSNEEYCNVGEDVLRILSIPL